ncbi:MAG: acyltransferase domain-containing protein, partial [bacterium]|nr:acyltransferase domain-containing protein [bacterium]
LADVAYTLQEGRKKFKHKQVMVCSAVDEAVGILTSPEPLGIGRYASEKEDKQSVVFMFSGQGAQYLEMAAGLFRKEPVFRHEMQRCFDILEPIMGYRVREILYPTDGGKDVTAQERINQTGITQPVLFCLEYALARLIMHWGVKPYAMIGHSIGEYTAACLSGVFSLEEALKLVALRGKLMQSMPGGSMLSVSLTEEQVVPFLNAELSMAAVNSVESSVVSGTHQAISLLEEQLKEKDIRCRRLHTSHAFHSAMMDPILKEFQAELEKINFNKPEIPYISNVTGNWISVEEACSPDYWTKHLRGTVRFAAGLEQVLKREKILLVEVGPGKSLSTFGRQAINREKTVGSQVLNLIRHPKEDIADMRFLVDKVGQLWLYGQDIDWTTFNEGGELRRVSLPTYPFDGQRYWIDGADLAIDGLFVQEKEKERKKERVTDWFYTPTWV